jgi:peptidyl-prolyl cis-trans isomerase NIMA-interacting 4
MVGAFEEKAFGTPVGGVTEPFKSPSGWHIVLVEGRKA